jgi:hypothetical protein
VSNGYLGLDLRTHRCDGHYVHRFLGLTTHGTIFVGPVPLAGSAGCIPISTMPIGMPLALLDG